MKIAIEGMDGVGKTTVAKAIAEIYQYNYIEKPLHNLFSESYKEGYETLAKVSSIIYSLEDPVIKAWFFGLGNLYTFYQYKDKDLIIDRHFASNYFWNGNNESNVIFKTMIDLIGIPDLSILLYASPKTRIERLYKRNSKDYDINDPEKRVEGYDKMIKFFNDFKIPYDLVNTEDKTIEEVIAEVNHIIKNKQLENSLKVMKLERK